MIVWGVCGHELAMKGPFAGKHLGETHALPYHPRCVPMQNREHYHGECYDCHISVVLDAAIARLDGVPK